MSSPEPAPGASGRSRVNGPRRSASPGEPAPLSPAKEPANPVPLCLYVHFPWCRRKCPYCDFNSHPAGPVLEEDRYVDALLGDLDFELSRLRVDREVRSVFLGGGTPSLFSPGALARLLEGIRARLILADDAEVTLEANPGTTEYADFAACLDAGINRLSIGAQSFDDAALATLGRIHTAGETVRAFRKARGAGFRNINLDLMYGLPKQACEGAMDDLDRAIALGPEHISLYQLTLEPNTVFHRYPPPLPPEDVIARMQEALLGRLRLAGFTQYEVSSHARDGRRCRHNLNYWNFGDYIGIGAGAHGKFTDTAGRVQRRARKRHPAGYLALAGTEQAVAEIREIGGHDLLFEFFMNAMRLKDGFALSTAAERTGHPWESIMHVLEPLITRELAFRTGDRIACTDRGYLFLDDALAMLLPAREAVAASPRPDRLRPAPATGMARP